MDWLDAVYGAVAGGGLVKILDHAHKAWRQNRTDLIQAEEDLRVELRNENEELRQRITKLETDRRDCNHKLSNREQEIVALKYELEKHKGDTCG